MQSIGKFLARISEMRRAYHLGNFAAQKETAAQIWKVNRAVEHRIMIYGPKPTAPTAWSSRPRQASKGKNHTPDDYQGPSKQFGLPFSIRWQRSICASTQQ
jgi:hypothetical protein